MTHLDQYRVLCFLDNDSGRDVEIVLPVVYYAEKYLRAEVEFAFIWDIDAIRRKKPDLVMLPNTIGSVFHWQVARYANQNGIRVFAMISEGNFRTDGSFDYWGYNRDKIFYQDYITLWSERTFNFLSKEMPEYKDRLKVTGATGFDRYQIYRFEEKEHLLSRYGLGHFEKVIGYAGWAFGKMYNKQGFDEMRFLHEDDPKKIEWIKAQMLLVEEALRISIETHPEILFILKRHPNEANPTIVGKGQNEMVKLKYHKNVLYITEEENIHDLINVSDIWMAFESTTALEAWLMNKQTLFVNPDPDFKRDKLYHGSAIVKNGTELSGAIEEFYRTGRISAFFGSAEVTARERLIADTIGFGDGLNHVRSGYWLGKVFDDITPSSRPRVRLNIKYITWYLLMMLGQFFYYRPLFKVVPKFKKTIWIFDRFRLKNIPLLKKSYWPQLDQFHKEREVEHSIARKDFWDKLFKKHKKDKNDTERT